MIKTIFLTVLLVFSLSTFDLKAADSGPPLEVLKTCNCEEYKELKEKVEKYK